jgi:hypothetical protein
MAKVVITPAQTAALQSALYDLTATEMEMETLRQAGVDLTEPEALRADLRKSLIAYLSYAQQQKSK